MSGLRVEWSSSNPGRVRVDPDGLATAVAPGSARIVATAAERSGAAAVRVLAPPAVRFREIVAAGSRTCALDREGRAYCWGFNRHGQAGFGRLTEFAPNPFPRPVAAESRYRSLAAGYFHTCGITMEGTAHCWGNNFYGQLGGGERTTLWDGVPHPVSVEAPEPFVELRPAGWVTCGLTAAGDAYCWGNGRWGQLGRATPEGECDVPRNDPVPCTQRPLPILERHDLTTIVVGSRHVCGLAEGGTAYCWGENGSGQLGDGTRRGRAEPAAVAREVAFVALAAGLSHTCGLTEPGAAWCWGRNQSGQLGDGTHEDRWVPVRAAPALRFTSLAPGGLHTCGLTGEGEVWCWGANGKGQLGDGSRLDRRRPMQVSGDLRFSRLTAGVRHSCGVTEQGAAFCWGANGRGQLGDGTTRGRNAPVRVADPLPPRSRPE